MDALAFDVDELHCCMYRFDALFLCVLVSVLSAGWAASCCLGCFIFCFFVVVPNHVAGDGGKRLTGCCHKCFYPGPAPLPITWWLQLQLSGPKQWCFVVEVALLLGTLSPEQCPCACPVWGICSLQELLYHFTFFSQDSCEGDVGVFSLDLCFYGSD